MERIILVFLVVCLTFGGLKSYAEAPSQPVQVPSPTVPQFVSFNQCSKIYPVDSEKLFFETLSAISANKFNIKEIQSRSGYIMFTCGNKTFITTVATVDDSHSIVKISPCDNNYFFPRGIVSNIYKYLDLSFNGGKVVNSSSVAQ